MAGRRGVKKPEEFEASRGVLVTIYLITANGTFVADWDGHHVQGTDLAAVRKEIVALADERSRLKWEPFIMWQGDRPFHNTYEPKAEIEFRAWDESGKELWRRGGFDGSGTLVMYQAVMPPGKEERIIAYTPERWAAVDSLRQLLRDVEMRFQRLRTEPEIEKVIDLIVSGDIELAPRLLRQGDEGPTPESARLVGGIEQSEWAKK